MFAYFHHIILVSYACAVTSPCVLLVMPAPLQPVITFGDNPFSDFLSPDTNLWICHLGCHMPSSVTKLLTRGFLCDCVCMLQMVQQSPGYKVTFSVVTRGTPVIAFLDNKSYLHLPKISSLGVKPIVFVCYTVHSGISLASMLWKWTSNIRL